MFAGMSSVHAATYIINASIVTQTTGFIPAGTLTGGDTLEIPSGRTNHLYFLDVVGLRRQSVKMNKVNCKIMKRSGMFLIGSGLFLFVGMSSVHAAEYYVVTSRTTVDGDTFCGGGACTSSDTIIIEGGNRGNLLLQDFDGSGSYIHIVNQNINPDSKVEIDGVLQLDNCQYVDLRGNNDDDLIYGFKVLNDGVPMTTVNSVRVMGQSDHIKISYIEVVFDGNSTLSGIGIFIQDAGESSSWTYDTIEIHHNYIHGSRYAGMYLGQNDAAYYDNPYIANVSVHDNIIDDSGAYGMVLKSVPASSGVCTIYNNIIRVTGLVTKKDNSFKTGISVHSFDGNAYAKIYNNRIEDTVGAGIKIGKSNHQIYNNKVLGCGKSGDGRWANGILLFYNADGVAVYDNIIIQPAGYGIYATSITSNCTDSRNLIGDAGLGERYVASGGMTESSGSDANWYESDVAAFNFKVWSDDGDYSNDDFSFAEVLSPEDLNQDSRTDIQDIQLCINVILERETDPDIVARADVNRDGSVNALDFQEIVKVTLG